MFFWAKSTAFADALPSTLRQAVHGIIKLVQKLGVETKRRLRSGNAERRGI
ncbi:MAG: hypothetical protein ABSF09_08195 [Candidatus Bathyarchaeia archaeon]